MINVSIDLIKDGLSAGMIGGDDDLVHENLSYLDDSNFDVISQ